ncbi:MAG TPA: glycosyltransferase, partial [Chloroflexia bacterium]|nr:glycosyltransferase [Chloroflexia bacterium]
DARKYVAASDVVVTMGGYNSLMEVASAGKRAVVVPRRGPSQEQKMRAALFASRGWVRAASDVDSVTGSELVGLIRSSLSAPGRSPWQGLRLDGGDKAVSALVSCLLSPRRRPCLPTRPEDWAFPGPRAGVLPTPPGTYPEGAPLHVPS